MDKKLLAIYIGAFIGPLGGNAVLSLIPTLKNDFNTSAEIVLLSIPFFMFPFAFFQLFSGSISDLTERRKVAVFGFLFYAIGSFICAISTSIDIFLLARVLQGFGFAFVSPVLVALLGDTTTLENRGTAMSYYSAFLTFGIALGPLIAGFFAGLNFPELKYHEGWRLVFVLFAFLAIFSSIMIWSMFSDFLTVKKKINYGEFLSQLKIIMKEKNILILCTLGFISFFCFIGVLSFLPDFLSTRFSMSSKEIGIILSSSGFAGIIASPIAGKSIDKKGRKLTALFGFLIFIITLISIEIAVNFLEHYSFLTFLAIISLLGVGGAFIWSSLMTISVELIPEKRGTVSSLFNSIRFFGYAVSPIILTPFYMFFGIYIIFIICLIAVLVAVLLLQLIKTKER